VSVQVAIARRAALDARTRTVAFAWLFAAVAYADVAGFRSAYPTAADRAKLLVTLAANKAVLLFYGKAYDVLTPGGYAAWRVGGTLAIFAAAFGLLAAVRAMRTEEDTGRAELVLASPVGRRDAYLAQAAAIAVGIAVLWLATTAGLVLAGLPAAGAAYLALAVASVAVLFAGIGALASQLASTRRLAIALGAAALAAAFIARVAADTSSAEWLRWLTPLGWAEEMRAFSGTRPWVLVLPVAAAALLFAAAGAIYLRRDIGTGLFSSRERREADMRLLSSPVALALREERLVLLAWLTGTAFFALVIGIVSASVASAGISHKLAHTLAKLGTKSITTPVGYVSLCFLFFVLAVSLYCCAQVTSARQEEAEERLDTTLALPVSRRRWLIGRLLLATSGAAAISLAAGLFAWAGAAAQGVAISLPDMLAAGANCLPASLLFLALGTLTFAGVPRASAGVSYGLVCVAFVWDLIGSLVSAPAWTLSLSPFHEIGLIPAQPFNTGGAITMLALAGAAALAALWLFARRDLVGE
jgi:polyether ionophore transport system permease protein